VLCWWVLWGIGASVCFVLCHQHLLLAVCKICYKSKTDFIKKKAVAKIFTFQHNPL
jgi:hypothetical protein